MLCRRGCCGCFDGCFAIWSSCGCFAIVSSTDPITASYQCVESFFPVLGSDAGVNHVARPLFPASAPVFLLSCVFVFSGVYVVVVSLGLPRITHYVMSLLFCLMKNVLCMV